MATFQPDGKATLDAAYPNRAADAPDLLEDREDDHKYLPRMRSALHPLFRSTVRGVYKVGQKTREMVAEAQEHVHDIVAEVNAEEDMKNGAPKKSAGSSAPPSA